jgi:putative DNA primase/helicase
MRAAIPEELRDAFERLAAAQADDGAQVAHLRKQSLAAHRFVLAVGDRVRFDHARNAWFLFSGHRWHLDRDGAARRLWMDVLGMRYRAALDIAEDVVRERTIASIQAAGALNSAITAGLQIAASMQPVALTGDEWDPDPWLLACENGVVELRTGTLRPGAAADMITRSTRHAYDPNARDVRWEQFLVEVFGGDGDLVAWFQRLIGASFVGTSKELLVLNYGTGNNGKSVCYETLGLVAGDYGVTIGIETLIGRRRDAGAPTSDLMRLRGARLAFASEPDQSARLRGGTLKSLATIDQMSGRELQGRQQQWTPSHTLHIATNHLPEADDGSEGFWRRIVLLPWNQHFRKAGEPGKEPLEDPQLRAQLAGEVAGILAWVVGGAVAYAGAGSLHPFPVAVTRETAQYRADEDVLKDFVDDCLERSDDDRVVASRELFNAYEAWAEATALLKAQRLNARQFGRAFAERRARLPWPVARATSSGHTVYRGLHIRQPAGGFGGFHEPLASSSYTGGESGDAGKSHHEPTKSTTETTPHWFYDEDVAERATDDDAELAIAGVNG